MGLDMRLVAELSRLGVRKLTLTKEAMDGFTDSVKGLFVPYAPALDLPASCRGRLAGIDFYVEEG